MKGSNSPSHWQAGVTASYESSPEDRARPIFSYSVR